MGGGIRVAVPTDAVVGTQLPGSEWTECANRHEKGGPDHVVFFHLETVDPVNQNQSSGQQSRFKRGRERRGAYWRFSAMQKYMPAENKSDACRRLE